MPAWTWREAGPDDYEDQARLFNTCFGKRKGPDSFAWKYGKNPHGPALSLVACAGDGRIVGGYSYLPRRFRRDGHTVLLMQASDAMVDPAARRQGVFTGLDDIVCEQARERGVPWAYAYSGRLSYTGFLGNGWRDIGRARVYRYRFGSRRGLLRLGRVGPLAARAAPLIDACWRVRDRRLARYAEDRQALAPVSRFDAGFTRFFEQCATGGWLLGERDADWLNWRYIDTPEGRQQCWELREPGGELSGWLVGEFVDGNAYLVDHLARDERARERLLAGFTALAHERGMAEASALLFEHHPAVSCLLRLGWRAPRRRKPFRDVFPWIIRACGEGADPADAHITRWWLADGDRDAEHMSP